MQPTLSESHQIPLSPPLAPLQDGSQHVGYEVLQGFSGQSQNEDVGSPTTTRYPQYCAPFPAILRRQARWYRLPIPTAGPFMSDRSLSLGGFRSLGRRAARKSTNRPATAAIADMDATSTQGDREQLRAVIEVHRDLSTTQLIADAVHLSQ